MKGILCRNHRTNKQRRDPQSKQLHTDSLALKMWPWFGTSIRDRTKQLGIYDPLKYAYFQNSIFIIFIQIAPFYVRSLQIPTYTARHVQKIQDHAFMYGTVSLVLSEVFKLTCTNCLKFKLKFSCRFYRYNI
jgi:hypothetical protein